MKLSQITSQYFFIIYLCIFEADNNENNNINYNNNNR